VYLKDVNGIGNGQTAPLARRGGLKKGLDGEGSRLFELRDIKHSAPGENENSKVGASAFSTPQRGIGKNVTAGATRPGTGGHVPKWG